MAEEPVTTLQFLLPSRLKGDYVAYNELQKQQGFDLEACCGKQVTRYTYAVSNYPGRPDGVQLNLYVCEESAPGLTGSGTRWHFPPGLRHEPHPRPAVPPGRCFRFLSCEEGSRR